MRKEERYLIRCLRAFLNNETSKYSNAQSFSWEYFLRLAKIHGVGGMVYLAVKDVEQIPDDTKNELKHQFDFVVSRAIHRDIQMESVESALCEGDIPHIYFKGYEICRYYPIPEVRLMSDVDILIRPQDRERVEKAMEKAGCICESKGHKGYVYVKGNLMLEIHTEFGGEPENGTDYHAWVSGGFGQGVFVEPECTGYFRPSYHFTYLVYHAAKHFNSTGAGIRMLVDLAVFWNHFQNEMDFEEVKGRLRELGLEVFARVIFWLCNDWFGTEIPWTEEPEEELREMMEEYILSGGVFGHQKRSISDVYIRKAITEKNEGNSRKQKIRVMFRYFFPNRKQMERFLPQVKKYPFLLPAAWMIRWYQGFFLRKKHSIQVIKGIEAGNSEAEKEYRMLKRLGLGK